MQHNIINQILHGKEAKKIALLVMICLLFIFFYTIFNFISSNDFSASPTDISQQNRSRLKQWESNVETDISKLHLFGEYIPKALGKGNVPQTLLDLKLVGVMLSKPPEYSQVLLAVGGGREKVYRLGSEIPGGAKIIRILANGIIIRHNGQYESLKLPQEKLEYNKPAKPLEFDND